MRMVAIVNPVCTPVGAYGGALRSKRPQDLIGIVSRVVADRTRLGRPCCDR